MISNSLVLAFTVRLEEFLSVEGVGIGIFKCPIFVQPYTTPISVRMVLGVKEYVGEFMEDDGPL